MQHECLRKMLFKHEEVKSMNKAYLDTKRVLNIRDLLLRLQNEESEQDIQEDFYQHVQDLETLDILLILQQVVNVYPEVEKKDIQKFFDISHQLYNHSILDIHVPESDHTGHPIQIFNEENQAFENLFARLSSQLNALKNDPEHPTEQLKEDMKQLGTLYSHYNRKEKLYFPILERYGIYTLSRTMWAGDDRIRTLYKATRKMMDKIPNIDFKYVKQAYLDLEQACKDMIFDEEYSLLPTAKILFKEKDWAAIAKESKAFGYAIDEPKEKWIPDTEEADAAVHATHSEHLRFGGGYLTIHEANHILNHLPLEITFVDKNGVFKYFNEIVESSEMMFIRTPTSIGRNVSKCHPPKSMPKVMELIRDLRSGRRESETMWFKKKDQFVHITYKGVFDENGQYLGILEYVQDIQPFLDLPREVKRELSDRTVF